MACEPLYSTQVFLLRSYLPSFPDCLASVISAFDSISAIPATWPFLRLLWITSFWVAMSLVGLMASEEKNNHIPSAKEDAQMKLRRHEIYKLVSAEKRETLLLQRRTNRQELQRNTVSEVAGFHVQGQCVADLQIHSPASQNPLLMDLSTISTVTANESHPAALPITSTKQKNVAPSFCVYEVGSTSGTSNSKSDMASKIIQNRAHNQRRPSWVNIGQLQSDYVHLKIVPNCKFCDAKRFEYEPPGFCCSSGSIKLVSNQVFIDASTLTVDRIYYGA